MRNMTIRCDRCGETVLETRDFNYVGEYGEFRLANHYTSTLPDGTQKEKDDDIDLCPNCYNQLVEWFWEIRRRKKNE